MCNSNNRCTHEADDTSKLQVASCKRNPTSKGIQCKIGINAHPSALLHEDIILLAPYYDSYSYSSSDELSTTACADSFVSLLASATSLLKMLLGFCTAQNKLHWMRKQARNVLLMHGDKIVSWGANMDRNICCADCRAPLCTLYQQIGQARLHSAQKQA